MVSWRLKLLLGLIIIFITFWSFLSIFLAPNYNKYGPNNLIFSKVVLLVELQKVFQKLDHWNLFALMTLFQEAIFGEIWRKVLFLFIFGHSLLHNFCKYGPEDFKFLDNCSCMSCRGYRRIMNMTQHLQ